MHKKNINFNDLLVRTPLIPFQTWDMALESKIYLKPENLQLLGSYKIRGIAQVIKAAEPMRLQHGLSAASAGNMAQAVAYAARELGIPCQIFVPDTAPIVKKIMIQKLGAELIALPFEQVWAYVRGDQTVSNQSLFIHPAFNEDLLKGYETIANEIMTDLPDADAIIIPFGVGGLSIGIGRAIHRMNQTIAIYTCEPETAAPMKASLKLGRAVKIQRTSSFVDAIGTNEVLPPVFERLAPLLRDSLVLSLSEIKYALSLLLMRHKLVCEGAAASSLAAALSLARENKHRKIVCVLSGGNIAMDILRERLQE